MRRNVLNSPQQAHDVFKGIADPHRRKILEILAGGEMSIATIKQSLPISRTAVIKHLLILKDAGLPTSRRRGREALFALQPRKLLKLRTWLSFFDQFWDDKLA